MGTQNVTGDWTEQRVKTALEELGLAARKPRRDVGVDLEVWHPERPSVVLNVQVKGRGKEQKNGRYRWFQIRTTAKQREAAVAAGLPVSEAWRKKVDLCRFFVLVSQKYEECWVFPAPVIADVIRLNRPKHGKRADNIEGKQAEMDLDIEHEGRPLTEVFAAYRNNFALIRDALETESAKVVGMGPGAPGQPWALDLRADVFAPVVARMKEREGSLREMKRFSRTGIEGWFKVEVVAALGRKVLRLLNKGADLLVDDGTTAGTRIELKAATNFDRTWFTQGIGKYGAPCLFLGDGRSRSEFPCTATDPFEVVGCEVFRDGAGGEWLVGLVKPRTAVADGASRPH
ncbi:MAG: hypothetical protein KIT58_03405 [Planctomycetota bacterium]|nr:hypothetical protein [Planctomycetota bacterium]